MAAEAHLVTPDDASAIRTGLFGPPPQESQLFDFMSRAGKRFRPKCGTLWA